MSGGWPTFPARRCAGAGLVILALMLAAGCAAPPRPAPLPPPPVKATLGPGDLVEVRFVYTPGMNLTQTVRADGKITLDIVGDVDVNGLTPAEVAEKLRKLYAGELKKPEITVVLRSQYGRRVFVSGQVVSPGMFAMPARMTLLEAVAMAQGVKSESAELGNVLVIRHVNGRRRVESFDLRPALGMRDADPEQAVPELVLHPGDIVYVPETRIVRIGRWVDQHINKIIPDTDIFVTTVTGTTTVGFTSN